MTDPTPRRDAPDLDPSEPLLVTPEQLSMLLERVETSSTFESEDKAMEAVYRAGYQEGACQMQLAVLEHAQRVDDSDVYHITES